MAHKAKPTALKDRSDAIMGYEVELCKESNAVRESTDADEELNQGHTLTPGVLVAAEP